MQQPMRVAGLFATAFTSTMIAPLASGQLRVVNYNVAAAKGDTNAIKAVIAAAAADDKLGFAVAPHVIVLQETPSTKVDQIEGLLDAAVPGINYVRATYTSSPGEDASAGAEALFYRGDFLTEIVAGHKDLDTGAGRKTDRWLLQLNGYSSASAKFYVYGSHLKASMGRANEALRLAGATTIRNDADALPQGTHIVYCGDFNLYSNGEDAYAEFLSAGNGQAFDPLGTGSWSGASNAVKHSQSPRDITADGLVGGGLDDRFDFQLSTAEFQDGNGLSLIGGTYRSLGNDGNHYNLAINTGNNSYYPLDIPRSNVLADNLFDATDHIPVIADYQIPAVMSATMPETFGKVIKGATFAVNVTIQNVAAGIPVGVDVLDYQVAAGGVLSGNVNGSAPLAPSSAVVALPMNTSTVGFASGSALVTTPSEATQNATLLLSTDGQIVRHSNASFSGAADVDSAVVRDDMEEGAGTLDINVPIWNYLFDSNQALLDIDLVSGLADRFSLSSGLQASIGATPATLVFEFNARGAAPGLYVRDVTINVSDENLPGASIQLLPLTLSVTVASAADPSDLNGDGVVDAADLAMLLGSWGTNGVGDINGDGTVDGGDLAILLGAWS